MKKAWLTCLSFILLLAACSADTVVILSVSALSLIPEAYRTVTIPIVSGVGVGVDLPDQQGIDNENFTGIPAGVFRDLQRFDVEVVGEYSLEGDGLDFTGDVGSASIELTLFLSATNSPFLDAPATIVQAVALRLGETRTETLSFAIDEKVQPELLKLLRTGDFKLGFRVELVRVGTELGDVGLATLKLSDIGIKIATKVGGFVQ